MNLLLQIKRQCFYETVGMRVCRVPFNNIFGESRGVKVLGGDFNYLLLGTCLNRIRLLGVEIATLL
jgi:hypothetical protein